MTNSAPRQIRVVRLSAHAYGFSTPVVTGFGTTDSPRFFGSISCNNRVGNAGYAANAGLVFNGALVVGTSGRTTPAADNGASVGTSALRYSEVYAANGTINTSDEREKSQIGPIPDEWLDAWGDVEWVRFKYLEAIEKKGDGARWHIGLVAQRVRDVFLSHGIDPFEIGLLCFDEWEDVWSEEEDESKRRLIKEAGDRFGIRYDQAQALEAAWVRREMKRQADRRRS